MKKILLTLSILFTLNCFSQAITVNTTTYSAAQLVNSVLINSPCVSATNITSKTGTDFGSVNGIGFFQNTNPNFPMKSGVILSTGSALNAVGPNTSFLGDGNSDWLGDTDLENAMAGNRISMHSTNATILEFDFTPISPSFNFEFLFASEEYGNYQCQFSDSFAFLLTNTLTGVTTNLAVVPNTTTPISVVTIRDFLYNSSCTSENPQYFGSYNGGSYAATSATNFNGQTKVINASATLVPDTPYHIKLVIADRSDSNSDSAIFLSSNSFNIGQNVLGLDASVANNSAVCFGDTYVLNSNLNPVDYTLSWKKDGVAIAGANGATLTVTKPGVYSVTYQKIGGGCQPITDSKKVEYFPEIITPSPKNLYRCDSGLGTYSYDLSVNTPVIKAGLNPLLQVSYYASLVDAKNSANPLLANYSSSPGQTIYARIQNTNGCYIVKSFQLLTSPPLVANKPMDLTLCSTSRTANTSVFNLSQQNAVISNGQGTTNPITFYTTLANATSGLNPINSFAYLGSNDSTIYARLQNSSDTNCYSITDFKLYVKPMPLVDSKVSVVLCDNYVLPALTNGNYFTGSNGTGTALFPGDIITSTKNIFIFSQPDGPGGCIAQTNFLVTIVDPLKIVPKSGTYCGNYTLPALTYGDYYTAPGATGTKLASGTSITSTQVIYYYYKSIDPPFCTIEKDFTVTIIPTLNVGSHTNVFDCSSYTLPALSVGKYYTEANAGGVEIPEGTVITTTQTVHIFATTGDPFNCVSESSIDVFIGIIQPDDIYQCNSYTLPVLPVGNYYTGPAGTGDLIPGGTVLLDTKTVYIYAENSGRGSNCSDNVHYTIHVAQPLIDVLPSVAVCDSFTLPALTNGSYYTNVNGTGTKLNAGDKITVSQNIYIYSLAVACSKQSSFTVTIYPKPIIESRSDIDICNSYVLTPLTLGNYFTGSGGTGTKLPAGTVIKTSQTIYIYVPSTGGGAACSGESSFQIHVYSIEADAPANVSACDSYILPALHVGNYYTLPGGINGGGVLLHAGDIIRNTQTIYVYTESGERINCTAENRFTITINKTPIVPPIADLKVCNSYTLPHLTIGNYFTGQNGTGTKLNEGDVISSTQTIYVFAETATTPNCTDEKSFKITTFNVDELSDVTICENYTLPILHIGSYYTQPLGSGVHLYAGQVIKTSQTIYIYAVSPYGTCYDESKFAITIIDTPVANPVPASISTVCDEDGINDGITVFDLSRLSSTVLGNQTAPEFEIAYYTSQVDAVTKTNPITSTNSNIVFVRVTNNLATSCYDVKKVNITVLKLPVPNPKGGIICYDSKTKTLLNPFTIVSGLSATTHTFKWLDNSGTIVGVGSSYKAILPGTYSLVATNIASGCTSSPIFVEVSPSEPALVSYAVTDDFSDNQILTIDAVGVGGDYEFQLDFGPFQDSPIFENVSTGTHTITVRDKNGCGNAVTKALVVNYPKFFTPNDDGINDTWNITSLKEQTKARIYIYDRYGKLLRELRPNGPGWDGRFGNIDLPSEDYWFTVNYEEDGVSKEFKSHFSMKR